MALKIVLTAVQASDCKTIAFNDITGADNLADSTKYSSGGTNPNIAIASIVITDVFTEDPEGNEQQITYNSSMPAAGNEKIYDSTTFGQTVSGQSPLLDGIYKFDYYVWDSVGSGTITIAQDDDVITTSVDLTSTFSIGDLIRLDGLPYTIAAITSSTITLDDTYIGTTLTASANIYKGYYAQSVMLAYCKVKCCLVNKIGDMASKDPCGSVDSTAFKYMKYYLLLQGAIFQHAALNYVQAQETIDVLTAFCSDSDCGCS